MSSPEPGDRVTPTSGVRPRPDASPLTPWPGIAAALIFGISYTQIPLFTSNQTHHFLEGLARAGLGWLRDDWQTHTADPFPVFSALVWFVHAYVGDWFFYAAYQVLIGAYIIGILGVVGEIVPESRAWRARLFLFTILTAIHNEGFGYILGFTPSRMPWWQMFTWGLAEQDIFGHAMFQGSAFGMLLPLALLLFLRGRRWWASALAAAVVVVHPSYALLAGGLVAASAWPALRERRGLQAAAGPVVLFAVAVAPIVIDVWLRFGPTTPATWQAARAILVEHLPRETAPFAWFPAKAWLQVALMAAGAWIVRRTALAPYVVIPLAAGSGLTVVQMLTGSQALALMFPWRVSVLLVPLATAVLVGYAARWVFRRARPAVAGLVTRLAVVSLVLLALGGVLRMTLHFGYFYGWAPVTEVADRVIPRSWLDGFAHDLRTDALGMLAFVRSTRTRGDTYLIPLDLERFRIDTGAPAYVDFKSHPYKDAEVLVWWQRFTTARRILAPAPDCLALDALVREGAVTHVVAKRPHPVAACPGLVRVYRDAHFDVLARTDPRSALPAAAGDR